MKRFSLTRPVKKGCTLEVVCVWGRGGDLWSLVRNFFGFVIWSWSKQWEVLLVVIDECCFCRLLSAKSRNVIGSSQQPAFMSNCLTFNNHTRLPCPSSRWVSPCVLYPLIIGLMLVLLTFFWGGEQMSIVLVTWKLMLYWGMGMEFKRKIMSNYSREVEWLQGINRRIGFCLKNVLYHSQ